MADLKKLEINKLIREFDYVKSDYDYKSEMIKEADSQFLKSIDKILGFNDELRSMYEKKIKKDDNTTKDVYNEESNDEESKDENMVEESYHREHNRSDKIKSLYRKIVKITHPDKIDHKEINDIYIEASIAYEENDIIGIYKICENLHIEYEIDISDIELIKENIKILKERISFIENTHTWIWQNEDEKNKDKIILNYIRKQII